jgi:multiple sugar transport system substrate-binding protein
MTLTRRALLRGSAAAAGLGLAGLATTGCSGVVPGRDLSGSLDFWNLFGGGDGVRMTEMLDGFRAAHPGI